MPIMSGIGAAIIFQNIQTEKELKTNNIKYLKATTIQCFLRIMLAKIFSNKLRAEPDNLFHPEFSIMRKKLLKIDDSRFR